MNGAFLWLVRAAHRPALERLVARLAPICERTWFPQVGGVLAFAATLSMTVPTVPLLCALIALNRRRWRSIAFWAVVGSASAGALFVHVLGHLGVLFIATKLPELAASAHWQHIVEWSSHHGWWLLAVIAALPIAQTPVLFVAAIVGMPAIAVFSSLFAGKAVKYGVMASVTAQAVDGASHLYASHARP